MNLGNEMIKTLHNGELDKAKILFKRVQKEGSDQDKFDLAEDLYDLGFVEESSILIDELLVLYPGEGELLVMKAEILVEMDQEEKAIELLSTVHEQDPNFPRSLLLQADLYQMQGLYEVSERKLLEAKEKAKDEVIIDFALGELYLEQGKFREAIKTYHYILNEKKERKNSRSIYSSKASRNLKYFWGV
ncbi:tetratricopeptide repeat protein [Bacillus coahuilensis]|uniref:tetratricopeptide repeat protein n=1 Tax=Bacillus coahuilensis TaxID=408580 RepID=UPI0003098B2F|nr:tetratricopeptide repeat protein [Bacillus coahuilensis]